MDYSPLFEADKKESSKVAINNKTQKAARRQPFAICIMIKTKLLPEQAWNRQFLQNHQYWHLLHNRYNHLLFPI